MREPLWAHSGFRSWPVSRAIPSIGVPTRTSACMGPAALRVLFMDRNTGHELPMTPMAHMNMSRRLRWSSGCCVLCVLLCRRGRRPAVFGLHVWCSCSLAVPGRRRRGCRCHSPPAPAGHRRRSPDLCRKRGTSSSCRPPTPARHAGGGTAGQAGDDGVHRLPGRHTAVAQLDESFAGKPAAHLRKHREWHLED